MHALRLDPRHGAAHNDAMQTHIRTRDRVRSRSWLLAACAAFAAVFALAGIGQAARSFEDIEIAVAILSPIQGNTARGVVVFKPHEKGVEITARIEGLPSGTRHGFHVHRFGDCSAGADSAGPHYDPTHNLPGMHQHGMKPLGDLEDLSAGPEGTVEVTFLAPGLTIAGAENGILGRGLLLHESAADPSDPMSSSGAAISCGTIGVRNPQS